MERFIGPGHAESCVTGVKLLRDPLRQERVVIDAYSQTRGFIFDTKRATEACVSVNVALHDGHVDQEFFLHRGQVRRKRIVQYGHYNIPIGLGSADAVCVDGHVFCDVDMAPYETITSVPR